MILPVTRDTTEELAVLGGKGCGLVRLLRAGLPVPETWVIPARELTEGDAPPAALRAALAGFWNAFAAQFPGCRLAVRSSATAEDLAQASSAGVYQTRLAVSGADDLVAAVGECWAAAHSERARAYREARGLGQAIAMAVLLQRMIAAELAGVLLTANPQRPFAPEIVIDAAWGLGEAVVSGRTDPDHLILHRSTGAVRALRLGRKERATRWNDARGLFEQPIEEARRERACLSDAQRDALFALARRVEDAIGPRQDLEWAFEENRLVVLQQRPITGLPPARPRTIWSRKFGDEYLADYTTPLSHTLLVRWIRDDYLGEMARLMGREDLADIEPLCRHEGYAYFNGEYLARLLRGLPPQARATDVVGWFPKQWTARIRAEPFEARRLLGVALAMTRDRRAPLARNEAALQAHYRAIDRTIVPRLSQDYAALSEDEWRRQLAEAQEVGREHFRVIRWGMGFHVPMLHGVLQALLARWCGDGDGAVYQTVISGVPGTRTAEINRDVWRLGALARSDPSIREDLRAEGTSLETLRAASARSPFWPAFDAFLARHGHRAATREVSQPRWHETPELVLGFVRTQVRAETPPPDPERTEAEAVRRRREAERLAFARAGAGPMGFARRQALRWLLDRVQGLVRYRENQRYHLDYLLAHIRALLLERGRRLVDAGVLAGASEIFFLTADELRDVMRRPRPSPALTARIAERYRHYLSWKDRLPATYLYDGVETEGEEADETIGAGGRAEGLGASRGLATGCARVVRQLADLESIQPGEILVAGNIDPGWTHVFPLIAGLVTETGGILSHGALLAREYGIPAVMGVTDAMRRYRTGEPLAIDGARGSVQRAEKPAGG